MKKLKYKRETINQIINDTEYFLLFFAILYVKKQDILYLPKLRKNGDYTMKCPIHKDETPSLRINSRYPYFKCFGCGRAGDFLELLQEYYKISFTEAVKLAIQIREPRDIVVESNSLQLKIFNKNGTSKQVDNGSAEIDDDLPF